MSSQPPGPQPPFDPFARELRDAALAPLEELIEAYRQHGEFVAGLVNELSRVVEEISAIFESESAARVSTEEAATPPPSENSVEIRLRDAEELLEFIDNLGRVPGVRRISVIAPGPGRATLLVELEEEVDDTPFDDASDEDSFLSSEQA